jgi:hypothetical protein
VDISSGNITTQDQLNGQGQFPWGSQVVSGGTLATGITQITAADRQITAGLTGSRTQSWTITPLTDSNGLQRLRALYRYVIGNIDASQLKNTYNINFTATNNNIVVDSSRIMEPQCVICLDIKNIASMQADKNNREFEMLNKYTEQLPNAKNILPQIPASKSDKGHLTNQQAMVQNIIQLLEQQISTDFMLRKFC